MNETPTPKRPRRVVRMWHRRNDEWCHAWDVEETAHRLWKSGKGPLPSSGVFLPNGQHPTPTTQVVCGTCKSPKLTPMEMRAEIVKS